MNQHNTANAEPSAPADCRPSRLRRRLKRALVIAQLVFWLFMAAAAVLVFTPLGDRFGADLVQIDQPAKADFLVVLGGRNARAIEAAHLYKQGWAPKIIVSSTGRAADQLAQIVIACGVPAGDVLIDRDASRTADHPATVAALPGVDKTSGRFIIVTSAYHTARSKACFVHAGYSNVLLRTPDWQRHGRFEPTTEPDWQERLGTLPAKIHEIVGLWYYRVRKWI